MRKAFPQLLLASLGLAVLFGVLQSQKIGRQFREEVGTSLQKEGALPPTVNLRYDARHAYLSGTIGSEEGKQALIDRIASIDNRTWFTATPGTAHVHADDLKVVDFDRAFLGLATLGDRVWLRGLVPSEGFEKILLAKAAEAYPGAQIVDEIDVAGDLAPIPGSDITRTQAFPPVPDGAPGLMAAAWLGEDWKSLDPGSGEEALRAGLSEYAPNQAKSHLDSLVSAFFARQAELEKIASLPPGWASLSQRGRSLLLSGQLPGPEDRKALAEAVRTGFPGYEIENRIELVSDTFRPVPLGETADMPEPSEVGFVGVARIGQPWQAWGGSIEADALRTNLAGVLPEGVDPGPLVDPFLKHREAAMLAKLPRPFAVLLGAGNDLFLHGKVREQATKNAVGAAVAATHPGKTLSNHILVDEGIRPVGEKGAGATLISVPPPAGTLAATTWIGDPWQSRPVESRDALVDVLKGLFPKDAEIEAMVAPLFADPPAPAPTPSPAPTPTPAPVDPEPPVPPRPETAPGAANPVPSDR